MVFSKQHLNIQRIIRSTFAKITLIIVFLLTFSLQSQAAEILDDSRSPRQQFNIQFEWAHKENLSALSKDEFFLLKAYIPNVEVRLDTASYMGRRARIYLTLPQQIDGLNDSGGFLLTWKTNGLLASGSIIPGSRALIFDGVIEPPLMTDFFTFTLKVDANRLTGKLRYAPIYEIELY